MKSVPTYYSNRSTQSHLIYQHDQDGILSFKYQHKFKAIIAFLCSLAIFFFIKYGLPEQELYSIGFTIVAIAALCIGYTMYCLTFERTLQVESNTLIYTDQSLHGIVNMRVDPSNISAIYVDRWHNWLPFGWVVKVAINDSLIVPVSRHAIGMMTYKRARKLCKIIEDTLQQKK